MILHAEKGSQKGFENDPTGSKRAKNKGHCGRSSTAPSSLGVTPLP